MKILIVDDEKKLCQLIQLLIDWDKLGLELVGVAYNGNDALKLMKEKQPDIVLTDIKMPGCDGLELIEQALLNDYHVRFIIISGYQDFDYARKALRFGVRDYLSKPIQEDELEEVLKKVIQERMEERKKEEDMKILKRKVAQQSGQIKASFMKDLINQELKSLLSKTLPEVNEKYHCNFSEGFYQILYIKPDIPEIDEYDLVYDQLLEKICEISKKEFQNDCKEIIYYKDGLGVCLLLNYIEGDMDDFRWRLKHIRTNVTSFQEISPEIHVTVGIGRPVDQLVYIEQSYLDARSAILNRICLGVDKIIGINDEKPQVTVDSYGWIGTDFKNQFMERIGMYDVDGMREMIRKLSAKCRVTEAIDGNAVFLLVKEIFDLFLLAMKNNKIQNQEDQMREQFFKEFYRCISIGGAFEKTAKLMQAYIEKEIDASRQVEIKPIKIVKLYIQEHYAEPIKLEDMADMVGFNAAYFSTMFKKETGETLTEYILRIRMDKAKELLKQKEVKINHIPEMIGIGDAKYFSKQFKKVSGLSPSQYRKFFG